MNALLREWPEACRLRPARDDSMARLAVRLTRPAGWLLLPVLHASRAGRHRFSGAIDLQLDALGRGRSGAAGRAVHEAEPAPPTARRSAAHGAGTEGAALQAPLDSGAEAGPAADASAAIALDFPQAVALLAGEPTLAPGTGQAARLLFLRRVLDSCTNVLEAEVACASALARLTWPQADYIAAEQGLVHGHAVHPTPKSRDEFTAADLRRYAPEFGGHAPLCWFAVGPDALWSTDVGGRPASSQLDALIAADAALAAFAGAYPRASGWSLLPVHAWQAHVLRQNPAYRHWQGLGQLVDLGECGADWYATSSLRAMYAPHAPAMLKFSMSVRLTNSQRVLQPAEVARGRLIHGAFGSPIGRALQDRCPSLGILHETAALALRHADGAPLPESFVIFRDSPFAPGTTAYVLATLCQSGIDGAPSMLSRLIHALAERDAAPVQATCLRWFERFLEVAIGPFLIAQADYGFLFSAHQQNTVLALEDGWPARIWFRDCQGTTFRSETIAALAAHVPGIEAAAELAFDEPMTERLFGYYLIVNNLLNVVATLGADGVADEARLCERVRDFVRGLRAAPLRYPHFLDYLLHSPVLMGKGNFMICFADLNETTQQEGSFRSYVPLANPLAKEAHA